MEIRQAGFAFSFDPAACEKCKGNCCRGESGNIWVSLNEIKAISAYLQLAEFDFIDGYLHKKDNRYRLREVISEDDHRCLFFDDQQERCTIYPVRPEQCRIYPFWDYFSTHPGELLAECPGVQF